MVQVTMSDFSLVDHMYASRKPRDGGGVGDPPGLTHSTPGTRLARPRDSLTPTQSLGCQLTPDPGHHAMACSAPRPAWLCLNIHISAGSESGSRVELWEGRVGLPHSDRPNKAECTLARPLPTTWHNRHPGRPGSVLTYNQFQPTATSLIHHC